MLFAITTTHSLKQQVNKQHCLFIYSFVWQTDFFHKILLGRGNVIYCINKLWLTGHVILCKVCCRSLADLIQVLCNAEECRNWFLLLLGPSLVLAPSSVNTPAAKEHPPLETRIKQDKSNFHEQQRQRVAQEVQAEKRQKKQVNQWKISYFYIKGP